MSIAEDVAEQLAGVVDDLRRLVAIPSVSADPGRAEEVRRSAEAVARLLREVGCPDVRVLDAGGAPAVLGRFPPPPGTPTVCLYAHHDVQPEGDPARWRTSPFEATEVDGRLYGRGSADDKAGFAVHLGALRAFSGKPPVGVTVFVEGEEEIGSPTLGALLAAHRDELVAEVYVIADSANWAVGEPAFTTTLRGLTDCVVEVSTLSHGVHSGAFGGVVPDALTALCRLLATLHDDAGDVAIAGLHAAAGPDLTYPPDRLRAETAILAGVDYIGTGSVVERLWTKPAVSVIGLDITTIADASNTLIPSARARVSLRLAPGEDTARARDALRQHLLDHAPWGSQVSVLDGEAAEPSVIPFEGPYAELARESLAEAYGVEPVFVGQGGTIPLVAEFAAAFPDATILVTAVSDPDCRAHGPDESVHLGDLGKACLAEALFLARLATGTAGR